MAGETTAQGGTSGFEARRAALLKSIAATSTVIACEVDQGRRALAPLDRYADGTPIKTRDQIVDLSCFGDEAQIGLRYDGFIGKVTGVIIVGVDGFRQQHLFAGIPASSDERHAEDRLADLEDVWRLVVATGVVLPQQ